MTAWNLLAMRVALLAALTFCSFTLPVSAAPKRPVGTVVAISGSATRTSPGTRAASLAPKDVIREGDKVVVPAGSSLVVQPTGGSESYALKGPQQVVLASPGRAMDRRWSRVTRRVKKSDLIEGEPQINTGVKEAQELGPPREP